MNIHRQPDSTNRSRNRSFRSAIVPALRRISSAVASALSPHPPALALSLLILAGAPATATAQDLTADDVTHYLTFTGAKVDLTIPTQNAPAAIELFARGAKGGDAASGFFGCESDGGSPARVGGLFYIGNGSNQLKKGGTLRFIVGEEGEDDLIVGTAAGGGGSAVLYQAPNSGSWLPLLVAGGGGGAHQSTTFGFCSDSHDGGDGKTSEAGGDGGDNPGSGGTGGEQGKGVQGESGGGGGKDTGGSNAGNAGHPNGGSGGSFGSFGGWGYGGGGSAFWGGGGGGGYSGGGGGTVGNAGGGGGSHINTTKAAYYTLQVDSSAGYGLNSYRTLAEVGTPDCANATPINDGSYTVDTYDFWSPLETLYDCSGFPTGGGRSAWFSYTNLYLFSIEFTASTCNTPTFGKVGVDVFESCPVSTGMGPQMTPPIACGTGTECAASQLYEAVTWTLEPNETALIRVTTEFPGNPQGFIFELTVSSEGVAATNDTCATAFEVTEGPPNLGNLYGATPDATPTACGSSKDDVWYYYDNTSSEELCVKVKATPLFSNEKLVMEASAGDCSDTDALACAVSASGGDPVELEWAVPAGARRYFRVANQTSGVSVLYGLELTTSTESGGWEDLGGSLAPAGGSAPTLDGDGLLCAGGTVTLTLADALGSSTAWLVLGLSEINAAFKGGVLVPNPDVVLPLPTDASGGIAFAFQWPGGLPSAFPMAVQSWVQDPAGPAGFSASNALRLTTP